MKNIIAIVFLVISTFVDAHESQAQATYLGNEGVMISNGDTIIIFDPFFHNNYDIYQLVPDAILNALFENSEPYNDIDAIFISHAHGDHFAADLVIKYLQKFPQTKLVAPAQAIDQLKALSEFSSLQNQIVSIDIEYQDSPRAIYLEDLFVEVIRVPHSGWPNSRLDVSNLVYRVTLDGEITVIHMGDADPNTLHFQPYENYWQANHTDTAFPPYWCFYSTYGPKILSDIINAEKSIGIHVPVKVPQELIDSQKDYLSKPSETRTVHSHH